MKFTQRIKDIMLGALMATMILGAVPLAVAAVTQTNLSVSYQDIKVYLDGSRLSLTEEPFVYNGTTFLPIRSVAEAVGKEVTWEASTNSVYLGELSGDFVVEDTSSNQDTATLGEQNAVKKAETYLGLMAFSREGLISQLEFEGFTEDEAIYGVDNCDVDWYEQAVKKAETYLSLMAFSKDGLIGQLEFEGFTDDQINYAITEIGY